MLKAIKLCFLTCLTVIFQTILWNLLMNYENTKPCERNITISFLVLTIFWGLKICFINSLSTTTLIILIEVIVLFGLDEYIKMSGCSLNQEKSNIKFQLLFESTTMYIDSAYLFISVLVICCTWSRTRFRDAVLNSYSLRPQYSNYNQLNLSSQSYILDTRHSQDCSICLSEMKEGEKVVTLPECMHTFHFDCVNEWANRNRACPYCRTRIPTHIEIEESPELRIEMRRL